MYIAVAVVNGFALKRRFPFPTSTGSLVRFTKLYSKVAPPNSPVSPFGPDGPCGPVLP